MWRVCVTSETACVCMRAYVVFFVRMDRCMSANTYPLRKHACVCVRVHAPIDLYSKVNTHDINVYYILILDDILLKTCLCLHGCEGFCCIGIFSGGICSTDQMQHEQDRLAKPTPPTPRCPARCSLQRSFTAQPTPPAQAA